jgi:hypothetical protein
MMHHYHLQCVKGGGGVEYRKRGGWRGSVRVGVGEREYLPCRIFISPFLFFVLMSSKSVLPEADSPAILQRNGFWSA